ncbi:MAG: amyloid fiber anchoring/assembly protein TapA [Bacillota bacterium]
MISIRYSRTRKHKTPTKKWKLLCQLMAIWYATTITTSFIDGSTGAYFNDQDHVSGVITAGTWSIWDKSSLKFLNNKQLQSVNTCPPGEITVTVINTGSTMQGTTEFAVYYAASGNPMHGNNVFSGDIQPINEGETATLKATVNQSGNYKFKALQRPGHGNKEDTRHELWSETITIKCEQEPPAPDKGGEDMKPEIPGNKDKDKKDKENLEVNVPAPTTEQSEDDIKEETPPKEEEKQEPEQPAAPAEPKQEKEEQAEAKAASEQSEAPPPKEENPSEPSPSSLETTNNQE